MVEYFKLDKIFTTGTTYELPADRFYVIKAIGTDASTDLKLVIDGVETGALINDVAPLHRTSSNHLGPVPLGDLFYVVPPNKSFELEGPSGAKARLVGQIGRLAAGEALPTNLASRFAEQGKHYITYVSDSYSLGTDVAWSADTEYEIYSLTPKTIETYNFNNIMMCSVSNVTVSEGDIAIRLYLDGTPLDILTSDAGKLGIDSLSMPYPPAATTEEIPFSLADLPIKVEGDHTFTVKAINTSGGDLTPASGTSITVKITALVEYLMK